MLLFIEWSTPSVSVSQPELTRLKKQKKNVTKITTNRTSTTLYNNDLFLTNLQPLICSLVTRTTAIVLFFLSFFPLWIQEWLMTTQGVWFNHRKSSLPHHTSLQELWGLSSNTFHCYSSDTRVIIHYRHWA